MNTERIVKYAKWLALTSFGLGTLILVAFFISELFNKEESVTIFGYLYLIVCVVVNSFYILVLGVYLMLDRDQWKRILISMGVLLLNIPVAFLYFFIVLYAII